MPARRTNPLPDAPKTEAALTVVLTPDDPRRLARVGGQFDEHLRQIERQLGIRINSRGNRFELVGADSAAESAPTSSKRLPRLLMRMPSCRSICRKCSSN